MRESSGLLSCDSAQQLLDFRLLNISKLHQKPILTRYLVQQLDVRLLNSHLYKWFRIEWSPPVIETDIFVD